MSASLTWLQLVIARRDSGDTAVAGARPVSYAKLIGMAGAAARWLDQTGVPPGTAVPALVGTGPVALALVLAGACVQRPIAPLGPRLTPRELTGCIDGLDAPLLVAEPEFAGQARAVAERAGLRFFIVPPLEPGERELQPETRPGAIAAILHTSGTTGAPKKVLIRQDSLAARVAVSSGLMGVGPGSVYASGSPFYHIAGLGNLAVMLAVGASVLPFPHFSIESWAGLGQHGVTHAFLVPTMLERLLDAGALTLPSLQLLQYGSAPIRAATLSRAVRALPGVSFINMFGQTEGSPIACLVQEDHERALADQPDLLASVGRPAPGIELRLAGADSEEVGEILARGAHLFKTAEDGWLHTGDLARMDEDGYVYLIGRLGIGSSEAARTSIPLRSRTCCASTRPCSRWRSSVYPTRSSVSWCARSSSCAQAVPRPAARNYGPSPAKSWRDSRYPRHGCSCRTCPATPAGRSCGVPWPNQPDLAGALGATIDHQNN